MDSLLVIVILLCALWIAVHIYTTYRTRKDGVPPDGYLKIKNKPLIPATPFYGANEVF